MSTGPVIEVVRQGDYVTIKEAQKYLLDRGVTKSHSSLYYNIRVGNLVSKELPWGTDFKRRLIYIPSLEEWAEDEIAQAQQENHE